MLVDGLAPGHGAAVQSDGAGGDGSDPRAFGVGLEADVLGRLGRLGDRHHLLDMAGWAIVLLSLLALLAQVVTQFCREHALGQLFLELSHQPCLAQKAFGVVAL